MNQDISKIPWKFHAHLSFHKWVVALAFLAVSAFFMFLVCYMTPQLTYGMISGREIFRVSLKCLDSLFLFFKMYKNMHHFAFSIRKLQNYHFWHINKGHNSMCIELIFKKFAGQMQMIIINIFASFNAYKIFHIYFLLIKNHFFDLWPWNFYMTPWGDFGGIFFENAPDPKLALGKVFSLLP